MFHIDCHNLGTLFLVFQMSVFQRYIMYDKVRAAETSFVGVLGDRQNHAGQYSVRVGLHYI